MPSGFSRRDDRLVMRCGTSQRLCGPGPAAARSIRLVNDPAALYSAQCMETAAGPGSTWTVSRLLTWTREYFQRHAVDSPRLCAELLLAHAMGCERIRLYTRYEAVPEATVLEAFRQNVREAAEGRPIAYLTGTKEFFSLPFEVTADVLIPRPETEVLVERTIDVVRRGGSSVRSILDLGTGSGCIAVSLARHLPEVVVYASDISEAALRVAERNAARHGLAERIRFATGDLFAAWPLAREGDGEACPAQFDVVVCNPPYIASAPGTPVDASVRRHEPQVALLAGADGLDVIRRVVSDTPARLRAGGQLLLEMAYDQAGHMRELLAQPPWKDVVTYRDPAGHERVVHARRGATGQMQVA
jgi:release factor glutamine methyltransferase